MKTLLLLLLASSAQAFQQVQPQDVAFSTFNVAALAVGTMTVPTMPGVSVYGIVTSSTPMPTSVSCTAGSPVLLANANNQSGSFTAGSLATACTVTFSRAWNQTPNFCMCNTGTTLYADATCSKTSITCTAATSLTGDTLSYFVWGPP